MIHLLTARRVAAPVLALAAMGVIRAGAAARPETATAAAPVTLQAAGEPVVDLLPRLPVDEKQSLTATEALGERRVDIFVAGLPAAKLRRALADVVGGLWVLRNQGATLRLEPDSAALREPNARLAERKRRFFDGLRNLVGDLSLDPAGLERLRKADPTAADYLTRPGNRFAIQLFSLLGEQHRRELSTTGRLTVTADQLGSQGRSILREFSQILIDQHREQQKQISDYTEPPYDAEEMIHGGLHFTVEEDPNNEKPYSYLGVGLGGKGYGTTQVFTGSATTNAPTPRWTAISPSASDTASFGPRVTVQFKQPPSNWATTLRQVAEAFRLSVVSEEYTRFDMPLLPLDEKGQLSGWLSDILDLLCQTSGYEWRVKAGIFQFRSVKWQQDRQEEPPGTLIKAAQLAGAAKRPLDLDWLARAVAVGQSPSSQRLWSYAPAAQRVVMQFRAPLQLYAALSAAQRAALSAAAGLDAEALKGTQRDLVSTMVRYQQPSWPVETTVVTRLRLTRSDTAARFEMTAGERKGEVEIRYPPASVPSSGSDE
jgi:hypothetical protein